jgi:hypothetical protein
VVITNTPAVPVLLAGRPMRLIGFNACYKTDVNANGSTLDQVEFGVVNDDGSPAITQSTDATDRTDATCRDYLLPTPVTITAQDELFVTFTVDFPAGGGFNANRLTAILQP